MSHLLSRRTMLTATGYLGAVSLLRSAPLWAQAAAPASLPPVCLTTYYLSNGNAKFDRTQFRDKAVPHLRSIYGDSLERIELRSAPRARRPDAGPSAEAAPPAPPVLAIANLWVKSLESYAAATLAAGDKLAAGMKGITNGQVAVQWEQSLAAVGEPRESVAQGSTCFTSLYRAEDLAKWDTDYITQTYLPKVLETYGADAVRRVEATKGVSIQGGGAPVFVGAVSVYIKDAAAFRSKGMQAGRALMAEGPKFTTIMPIVGTYDVFAVG